jgi:hypothetical protein
VDAGDFTQDPDHGADMAVISEAIRVSRDRRVSYVIWNRHITGPSHGWRWDPYDGSDPHTNHMHVSVNDVHHDETQDWSIGVATITQTDWDALIWRIDALTHNLLAVRGGPTKGEKVELVAQVNAIAAGITAVNEQLKTLNDQLKILIAAWQGPTVAPGTPVTGTFTGTVQ